MTAIITFLKKWVFFGLGFAVILMLVFIKGCQHGKSLVKIPVITTETITVHDTIIHNIVDTFPYYVTGETKIEYQTVYKDVDTAVILKDYFSTHITDNRWQDSLVQVDIKTYISQNELKHSIFKYKILRDQQIVYNSVDNSVNFARYVYLGASLPVFPAKANTISNINYIALNGLYAFPKGYAEITYQPYTKIFTVGTGIKIFKFKK